MKALPFSRLLVLGWRNIFRNKRRSTLTLLSVLVGGASCLLLAALARGMGKQLIDDAIYNLTGHIQIHAAGYLDDPAVEYSMPPMNPRLKAALDVPQVTGFSERVRFPAVLRSERESVGVSFIGIDPESEKGLSFIGDGVSQGRMLESSKDSGLVVGEEMLELLQTDVGKRVVLMAQDKNGKLADRGFRIVGTFSAELASTEKLYIFTGRATAQKMLGLGDQIAEIAVRLQDDSQVAEVLAQLRSSTDLDVQSWREISPLIDAMTSIQDGFLIIWFFIVILTVSFGLVNTIFMGIYERVRELGVIQAIGMPPVTIIAQILVESALLLLLGALLGTVVGVSAIRYFERAGIDVSQFSSGTEVIGISSMIYPHLIVFDLIMVNALIVLIGIIGATYPAWFAARLSPAEAMGKGGV